MSQYERAKHHLDGLVQWVEDHKGDVDATAFCDACDEVLSQAIDRTRDGGGLSRFPSGLRRGLPTLNIACCILRRWDDSTLATKYPSLPGARYLNEESEPV